MSTFVQGEKREKTFYVRNSQTGLPVGISEIQASLYDPKTNREIARFDDTQNTPTLVSENIYKFTFSPDITRKCPLNVELWFDIYVGNLERIFRGKFGTATKSPLSNV